MKAKTLMGMIACASACVSLSAFGNTTNDWFAVTVDNDITTQYCATNGAAVTVKSSKIVLDNDKDSALTITPEATFTGTNRNDGVYVIKATAALTPCSTNDFEVTTGAKAGFAVGIDDNNATNYYGYADSKWTKYTDATVVEDGADTTFKIVLNYRDSKVQFYAGQDAATYLGEATLASGTTAPVAIDAFGSGSITSINSGYEVAVAEYNNKRYGSYAEAVAKAGNNKNGIAVVDNTGTTKETGAAANGLQKWECAALQIDEAEQVALAKSAKQNAGKITLAVQNVTPESGLTVKYGVSVDGGAATGSYDADDIQIPMGEAAGSRTYKIEPTITATAN